MINDGIERNLAYANKLIDDYFFKKMENIDKIYELKYGFMSDDPKKLLAFYEKDLKVIELEVY